MEKIIKGKVAQSGEQKSLQVTVDHFVADIERTSMYVSFLPIPD